jgi:opacity protein-like surface antigen
MKKLLLALAISTITSGAFAADASGPYMGAEAGYAKLQSSDGGVGVGRFYGGYNVNENVGLELGLFRTANVDYLYPGTTVTVHAYGADASVLLRPSISSGFNGLFARIGLHDDNVHASATNGRWADKWGGGVILGAGYDAKINENLSARISYSYLDNVAGSDYSANVGSLGLNYKF